MPFDDASALLRNKLRTAVVWMDEYARFVLPAAPRRPHRHHMATDEALATAGVAAARRVAYQTLAGDTSARSALRERLRCNNFSW